MPSPVPTSRPYGAWTSPLTPDLLTAGVVGLSDPAFLGADLCWLEARADEGGRVVLVRRGPDGTTSDLTPAPYNVRSRVHEYGGGAYAVVGPTVVFTHFADLRVYRIDPGGDPVAITPEGPFRYGGLVADPSRDAVLAVREDHTHPAPADVANTVVRLDLRSDNSEGGEVLVSGSDFVSAPALSADGRSLAWVSWDHPNMPWDSTTLWRAELDADGRPVDPRRVGGGPDESVVAPAFAGAELFYVSDRTGYWNVYADTSAGGRSVWATDHDCAGPQWTLGQTEHVPLGDGRVLVHWTEQGFSHLGIAADGAVRDLGVDLVDLRGLTARGSTAAGVAGFTDRPAALVEIDLGSGDLSVVRASTDLVLDPAGISRAEPVQWAGADGDTAYGFFYRPVSADHVGPDDQRPPLVVVSHGGPTSAADPSLRLGVQFWTSRGFAVLDVDYGGSTGYGRAYRQRLAGRWGIVDVEDCTRGAVHLADEGRVDRARLAIRGGSAGGYTTLACLAFRDVFAAGASHFGVGDLEALARDTHKFESRYLDSLVGPYPADVATYRDRSPVHFADRIDSALLLLQGTDDRVVPPDQAEEMAAALRSRHKPVALLLFAGEGHGFRAAASIIRAAEAELSFYGQVFGFSPAGDIVPVEITR